MTNIRTAECWDLLLRHSDLNQLLRITAAYYQTPSVKNTSLRNSITTKELQLTKFFWVNRVQKSAFQQELQLLKLCLLPIRYYV